MVASLKMEYYVEATDSPCLITRATLTSDREAYFQAFSVFQHFYDTMIFFHHIRSMLINDTVHQGNYYCISFFFMFVFMFALPQLSLMTLQLADAVLLCKKVGLVFCHTLTSWLWWEMNGRKEMEIITDRTVSVAMRLEWQWQKLCDIQYSTGWRVQRNRNNWFWVDLMGRGTEGGWLSCWEEVLQRLFIWYVPTTKLKCERDGILYVCMFTVGKNNLSREVCHQKVVILNVDSSLSSHCILLNAGFLEHPERFLSNLA